MNPTLKDLLIIILPTVLGFYATFVIVRERQRRSEIDESELRKDVKAFMSEFRTYLENLKITIHEHTVMQQIMTTTIQGLINKMEALERRVNTNEVKLAVILSKEQING